MKIGDKAAESPEVSLSRDSPGAYRLKDDELTAADEITAEGEFPKYGDFLSVSRLRNGKDGVEPAEEQFVECPQSLAQQLVEIGVSIGDDFRILSASKVDGEWQIDVERLQG
jgi:hypothetical protein